jgi:hypothetical protein
MRVENNYADRPTIPHGDATGLFPVENLTTPITQNRDAYLTLQELDDDDVLLVTPDGMASGYFLGAHPLTLIAVDDLSAARTHELSQALERSLAAYSHIQIGRNIESGSNRSLTEFASTP